MPEKKYCVVRTKRAVLGRFAIRLDIVKEGGKEHPYSYVEAKDSVAVLAEAGGRFVLIRQYRHSVGEYVLEIPGGSLEEGEDPAEAAGRELLEETGYVAGRMVPLGSFYPSVGSIRERCHLFYAECAGRGRQALEPLEYLAVEHMDAEAIEAAIAAGELVHSMALAAWLKYRLADGKGYAD